MRIRSAASRRGETLSACRKWSVLYDLVRLTILHLQTLGHIFLDNVNDNRKGGLLVKKVPLALKLEPDCSLNRTRNVKYGRAFVPLHSSQTPASGHAKKVANYFLAGT